MNIKIIFLAITLSILGCDDSSDDETNHLPLTQEKKATILKKQILNIGELVSSVNLPPVPDKSIAKSSVNGADTNNDGIRDDLEHIVYQGLNTIEGISKETHKQVLSIISMIQPKTPSIVNSINKHDIYCAYRLLSKDVKDELPLKLLYSMVLDTQERKNAFNQSLEASTESLGAELCE